jgi:hypothetical protein
MALVVQPIVEWWLAAPHSLFLVFELRLKLFRTLFAARQLFCY